jgi:putative ABC transport system ATP-binding protein
MIKVKDIKKSFKQGEVETRVLKGVNLEIKEGEFVAVMGRSGAGKSTLLYQMSLLDDPNSGDIIIDGVNVSAMTQVEKTNFRLKNLGFVFQDYALIPELTASENIALPLLMQGYDFNYAIKKAHEILETLGLEKQKNNLPNQMSGGEQQRVSIARAVVHSPKIIFADEPTANLDLESSKAVIKILEEACRKFKHTVVMVTHEEEYGNRADRIIRIVDGKVGEKED